LSTDPPIHLLFGYMLRILFPEALGAEEKLSSYGSVHINFMV
jgi:hypothetical protein